MNLMLPTTLVCLLALGCSTKKQTTSSEQQPPALDTATSLIVRQKCAVLLDMDSSEIAQGRLQEEWDVVADDFMYYQYETSTELEKYAIPVIHSDKKSIYVITASQDTLHYTKNDLEPHGVLLVNGIDAPLLTSTVGNSETIKHYFGVTDPQELSALADTLSDFDNRLNTLFGDYRPYKDFFLTLQNELRTNNTAAIASMVSYPLKVTLGEAERIMHKPSELVAAFDTIFTEALRQKISDQSYQELFANSQGVMVASGVLWFVGVSNNHGDGDSVKIIAINPAPPH